jgi:hypothetical protein
MLKIRSSPIHQSCIMPIKKLFVKLPVHQLIFYTTDDVGAQALAAAQRILERDLAIDRNSVNDILEKIYAMSFKWGVGDGN